MKLQLTRPARINYTPGDIVEVSPEQASFLIGVGSAVPVVEKKEAIENPEAKKTVKKTVKK